MRSTGNDFEDKTDDFMFEKDLREQLRRVDAPLSLAEAVMTRAAGEPRPVVGFPWRSVWLGRFAALFLLTALLFGVGAGRLAHKRAAERTRAEQNFATSQVLIGRALEPVRQQLRRAGVPVDE